MSEEELTEMILHLGRYALRESSRLRWRTGNPVDLPGGETVESIVSLAIEKVLSGARRWDPQSSPDIKKYLMDVIDSLLNHLATGKENVMFTTASPAGGDDETVCYSGTRGHEKDASWLGRREESPEVTLLRKEEEELNQLAIETLMEESRADPVLMCVLQAMLSGEDKAGRIAEATGVGVKEVYNAMKRLDRKAAQVLERIKDVGSYHHD
jgi:hypothetical protein